MRINLETDTTFFRLFRSRIRDGAYDPHYPCSNCRCKEQPMPMLADHCFYQPRPVEAKTRMYKAKLLHDHFYQPRPVEAGTQIRSLTRVEVKKSTSTTLHIVTQQVTRTKVEEKKAPPPSFIRCITISYKAKSAAKWR